MTRLKPLLVLVGRPAVFVMGLIGLACVSVILMIPTDAEFQEAFPSARLDLALLAVFLYPATAGFLVGGVMQDLEHCSFTWMLPGVRRKTGVAFLAVGAALTAVVTLFAWQGAVGHSPFALFAVGLLAYCLGSLFLDPLSRWGGLLSITVTLVIVFRSADVGDLCRFEPALVVGVAVATIAVCTHRLLGVRTFRFKPFLPTPPLPGAFAVAHTLRYDREKLVRQRQRPSAWRSDHLGDNLWAWLRAAFHEGYGGFAWTDLLKMPMALLPSAVLVAIHAAADAGDLTYGEALARVTHHVLLDPPHVPPLGDDLPHELTAIVIGAFGGLLFLSPPPHLRPGWLYPLSRRRLWRVAFWGCLAETVTFGLVVGGACLCLSWISGLLAGYDPRFDFVPLFLRSVLATVCLLPLVQRFRFRTHTPGFRKGQSSWLLSCFCVVGMLVAVPFWSFLSPTVVATPRLELLVFAVLIFVSQLVHWRKLGQHYATADLA